MSNTQTKNVPELRFPGFEGEWEEKKLGEFCEFNNGINAKKEQYGMGRKFINVLDILNNNFITYENIIGKVSVPENVEKNNKVEFGDLVFLRSSETREDVGLCNVYLDKNYALYGGFIIRGKKVSDYNPIFLKEALNIPKKRYEIGSAAGGSTRFNVSQDILRKINVKFPPIKEQQKIGDLFSKLDRQIELEEQKLELLQQQKKGYMQKIFSQELRFKDENGNDYPEWTNENFKDLFKVVPSKKYQIKSSEIIESGKIPVVDQGKKLILGFSNQTDKVYKEFNNVIIYGDHTTIIKKMDVPFIIGGDGVKLLAPISNNNLDYFFSILQYFNIESEGYKRHFSILKDKNFYTANSNKEQQKIGCFFKSLDLIINKQFTYLELLKSYKKGIIQKMFV
ncbi:TPA: restriction endonuclease subunit S [Staphylococcus aureus]|nr:restriction endonuclease subunit S [Staphylococcus aureus]HDF3556411.1 restriction endonuclease subunit S [Staphylococcus aureus]HDT6952356.1 restriction endonuclease subunit S [Staphylococcus aureus]HDT6956854.1 restriction endonuclease subunit S [Staphylococcus aureus]HDT6963098.1 restriction endonuclease subunit S [Staphylococcus aureus]